MVYKFFDKKSTGSDVNFMPNYQLANEFYKQIIWKFTWRIVYSSFKDNIWGVADMKSLSKYKGGTKYLLRAIYLFWKYVWVVPVKEKRGTTIVNASKAILDRLERKPNKIWVEQGGKFYKNLFKRF